jgi:methionyl-tRNA formyltransferase
MTRVVFMGSADFSLPTLKRLAEVYEVVGVVTQPDRPAGRGKIITPPPVKNLAIKLGIDYFQPNRLRIPESFTQLAAWRPDLIVVAAYGQILRQNVLDLPSLGCINVHASLLPRWRGAAPIQAALLHGDATSGVTIMKMDAGVDTGVILSQREVEISPSDTSESLSSRLAESGASLLIDTLPDYLEGKVTLIKQDDSLATYAPMLKKEDGELDFNQPVVDLERRVRAFYPWPGTYMTWRDLPLIIIKAHAEPDPLSITGKHAEIHHKPAVGAINGWLVFDQLQPAGKNIRSGEEFLRGARSWLSGS